MRYVVDMPNQQRDEQAGTAENGRERQELAVPIEFARALKAIDDTIWRPSVDQRPSVFQTVNGRRTLLR